MTLTFHPAVADEVREAARWYANHDAAVEDRFLTMLRAAISDIEQWPSAGSPWQGTRFRLAPVEGFPYRLAYETTADNNIRVLACAHEKRRPGYWVDRT